MKHGLWLWLRNLTMVTVLETLFLAESEEKHVKCGTIFLFGLWNIMHTLFGIRFSAILSKCSHLLLQYSTLICNLLTYNSSSLPSAPLWSLNANMWNMEPNLTESNCTCMPLIILFMYAFYTGMNTEMPVVI